jgi:hypothetical protein
MLFQEAVELIARGNTQKYSELTGGNAPLAVGFEADGFERRAGRVLTGRRQFVGDFEGDPRFGRFSSS